MYMYHNFFIPSSVNGYRGCFHVLPIVNSAAMNNGIHVSFSILLSSGYIPQSGIVGSYGQYSCLETPMDGGAWLAAIHGVTKGRTRLSDFTFTFHFHSLEKEMATHSSVLVRRIPGTKETGGLPSMGSHRVRCNWSDLAAAAAAWWFYS